MKVIEAEHMGMCFGVRDALAVMRAAERPAEITVFGQLVHNPVVTRELGTRGFVLLDEATRAFNRVQTARVLITAHGVSNRTRERLKGLDKELIDTTCPLVKKANAAALKLQAEGYFVIVIGKRGHVEVRGLTGDLDRFDVVEKESEARVYESRKLGIVSQTTCTTREVEILVNTIRELNPRAEIRTVNTICQPTRDRQSALLGLLDVVNVLVAVGGRHSNNTAQLVGRAREAGLRALHVEDAGELAEEMFGAEEVVGLTAGTSTLPETVEAVRRKLEGFHERGGAPGEAPGNEPKPQTKFPRIAG